MIKSITPEIWWCSYTYFNFYICLFIQDAESASLFLIKSKNDLIHDNGSRFHFEYLKVDANGTSSEPETQTLFAQRPGRHPGACIPYHIFAHNTNEESGENTPNGFLVTGFSKLVPTSC